MTLTINLPRGVANAVSETKVTCKFCVINNIWDILLEHPLLTKCKLNALNYAWLVQWKRPRMQ